MPITSEEWNARNRAGWAKQTDVTERHLADPILLEQALIRAVEAVQRPIDARSQRTFEDELEEASCSKERYLADKARRGGQAKRPDGLQARIVEIARRCPEISAEELLARLRAECPGPVIVDMTHDRISFATGRDGQDGFAAISSLPDRLTRAKKYLSLAKGLRPKGRRDRMNNNEATASPVFERASARLCENDLRKIPAECTWSREDEIRLEAAFRGRILRAQSQLGGRADKRDALQKYICDLIRDNPKLRIKDLLAKLNADCDGDLIRAMDEEEVWFRTGRGTEESSASISGLKDRLSRAKRSVKSRGP